MNKTSIEWVKNPDGSQGYTLNSKTGCKNYTPEGLCLGGLFPCYAFKLAHGRLKPLYLANRNVAPKYAQDVLFRTYKVPTNIGSIDPFYPRFWEERLRDIPKVRNFRGSPLEIDRKGIFLDDMSDWMLDCWPEEWTQAELKMMRDNPQHRIYTLTKQPQNLHQFSPFPDNAWVGITATNGEMAWTATAWLKHIQAKVKFISFEPLLAPLHSKDGKYDLTRAIVEGLDWLIIGVCTGNLPDMTLLGEKYPSLWLARNGNKVTAQPRIEWVKEIVEAADRAGIPVFLKDNLKPLFENTYGQDIHSYYYHNGLRQEMPNCPK